MKTILINTAYLGKDGKFYIPNPINKDRVAVYQSIEAYDNQSQLPYYIDKKEAEKQFLRHIPINIESLKSHK